MKSRIDYIDRLKGMAIFLGCHRACLWNGFQSG